MKYGMTSPLRSGAYGLSTVSSQAADNVIVCTSVSKTFSLAINTSNIIIPDEGLRQTFADKVSQGHYAVNAFGYKATELAYNHAEGWLDAVNELFGLTIISSGLLQEHLPKVKAYVQRGPMCPG